MPKLIPISFIINYLIIGLAFAQPSKKYLMAFHTCTNCAGPQSHTTRIAESNDGSNWSLVPNFNGFQGSVPDPIIRGNKLYIYTPGKVNRYNNSANTWEPAANVSIKDSNQQQIMYVDPSAILDDDANIVLFFMNSTGLTGDPAFCQNYPRPTFSTFN